MVDCNKHFISGKINDSIVDGWGYSYYTIESNGLIASTQMGCPDLTKTKKFISMESKMIRYNSKLPIVIYLPEGMEVKYRIWNADRHFRFARPVADSTKISTVSTTTKTRNSQIENKRWQLIELNGKRIEATPESAYVIFHSQTGKMQGKAQCNMFSYGYSIKDNFRLEFDQHGVSTRMACPDGIETEFIQMLSLVDNFTTDGTYLSLNRGRVAPLARFVLVK